jgi:hypothetical protein
VSREARLETGGAQTFNIALLARDFLSQFVENIEVMRKAHGVLRAVEHDTGEVALLPVPGQDADLFEER